jgi:phosphoribosylformylglycinamidine (FGAM) synthase-like enzyme
LLVTLSEGLIARGLGASIEIPAQQDPWEFSFGEGFHSFVISLRSTDGPDIEAEWKDLGVPFLALGQVTSSGALHVNNWKVETAQLEQAWRREGYWE